MTADASKEIDGMDTNVPSFWRQKRTIAGLVVAAAFVLGCAVQGDVVAYDLPAESARYTLEAETNGVKTVWTYTSARADQSDIVELQPCMGETVGDSEEECRPEPLIFLRYDLGLDLDNTAKAEGAHPIKVIAYYQERLSSPPEVTTLLVEVSFDVGTTWRPAISQAAGKNTYTAEITHPRLDQAANGVALRITAADSAGNTVKQTIPVAHKLR
jgi:hypothetical protein